MTVSRYDVPGDPRGVREMFKRIQGFNTTLKDPQIKKFVAAENKIRRKYPSRSWDFLTDAMYEAEPKIVMPTVWFRWRWTSTGGNSEWKYEDSRWFGLKSSDLRAIMQDRISERSALYGRASADWNVIDPPQAVVNEARSMLLGVVEEKNKLIFQYGEALGGKK
jgi:hypothetical protein